MEFFQDRFHAGQFLAEKLRHYQGRDNLLVLGLPRGGVPVAFEVAKFLKAPLDVFLVRKLGLPGHRELAMGAIAMGGIRTLNHQVVDAAGVSSAAIGRVADREKLELQRQQQVYRRDRPLPRIAGWIVILVDDGLATGSTMRAAAQALRLQQPQHLVVGVPVGAAETCEAMQSEVDEVICATDPQNFMSVGSWYEDFSPTSDEQVQRLLEEALEWVSGNSQVQRGPPTASSRGGTLWP
jgi:putative phosphoribosyl transferase